MIANLSLILFTRSGGRQLWRHVAARNRSLWTIVIATVLAYAMVVAIAPLRELFHIAAPVPGDAVILGIATGILWVAFALLGRAYESLAVLGSAHRVTR